MPRPEFKSYTLFALSYNEYLRSLLQCKTNEEACLIVIACEYGLRRDDIVALELANIDFKNKRISFSEHKKGGRILTRPLSDAVISDLQKHINTLPNRTKYLFPSPYKNSKTGHKSGSWAWRTLQDLCSRADIPAPNGRKNRPFHSLRGTCYKLRRNRDKWTAEQCAAWLGDTITTAMKHYGAVSDAELDDLVRGA